MDLKDILKDSKQFPDNVVYSINGNSYTLGALRTLTAAEQKAVSDKEAAVLAKEAALNKSFQELQAAQQVTADLYAKTVAEQDRLAKLQADGNHNNNNGGNNQPDPLAQLEQDNILGPLVRTFKQQLAASAAELGTTKTQLAQMAESTKKMAEAYVTDRIMDTYERVVPADKRDKMPLENLIKHAMDRKQFTRSGIADVSQAYAELTAADRQAASEADLRAKLTKEITDDLISKGIVVRPPSGMGGGLPNGLTPGADRQPSTFKSLDDAFAAAAKDTALWTNFENMAIQ